MDPVALIRGVLTCYDKQYSPERPGIWGLGSKAKKVSWTWKRDPLDQLISDLDIWHHRFNPLWFMVMKLATPLVDTALAGAQSANVDKSSVRCPSGAKNPLTIAAGMRRVLVPSDDQPRPKFYPPRQMKTSGILYSGAKTAFLEPENKWYIIDTIEVGPSVRPRDVLRDVSMLAAKLAQADSIAFGLLNCKGVIPIQRQSARSPASSQLAFLSSSKHDYTSFQLVFRLPEDMLVLQSLRQLLLSSDEHISLSRKMRMARELAKAIHYVHTFAFVHKNVRPESILCFEDDGASRSHAFLVGFDAFRAAGGGTIMSGDISWERNVYRHPSRQGFDPAEKYRMQHDIYSLGVCLLEIGLWESFVEYGTGEEDSGRPRTRFGRTYSHFKEWLEEKKTAAGEASVATTFSALASSLKDYLVEQASTKLAPRMGDRYAQVVLSCLTCLDEENEYFDGSDWEIEDVGEDTVAICFVEKILNDLDQLSMV
ncbi:hypothetical protein B0H65DRAFT_431996 [Neurospora tetraspora]|uniref:Protein kinase domain-containing protein n=1 Tax=Neurospora tetraspora TaxID=94610 RepID=A0AAE0MPU7_9PEZI|nr:hypothetical protein B0H65DRAFT_431996 [Neurospora tetraspora]